MYYLIIGQLILILTKSPIMILQNEKQKNVLYFTQYDKQ